jgi:hypothetical protein
VREFQTDCGTGVDVTEKDDLLLGSAVQGDADNKSTPTPMSQRRQMFWCAECQTHVPVDEDRCCRMCGHDAVVSFSSVGGVS